MAPRKPQPKLTETERRSIVVFFLFLGVLEAVDFAGYFYQSFDINALRYGAAVLAIAPRLQLERLYFLLPITAVISFFSFWLASAVRRRYSVHLWSIVPAVFLGVYAAFQLATIAVYPHTAGLMSGHALMNFGLMLGAYALVVDLAYKTSNH
jgi:hypothetical protein